MIYAYRRLYTVLAIVLTFTILFVPVVQAQTCPNFLTDTAHVVANPPGNDYDVWYTNDVTSAHHFFDVRANWVRDALPNAHNVYVGTPPSPLNFRNPHFSATPNDTCIYDSLNVASAPENQITVDAPSRQWSSEPVIRTSVAHELFHHVQYSYIDYDEWLSWGRWNIEGTARAMEDKTWRDNDITPNNTNYVGEVNGYLANPNRKLFDLSYPAALFWTYLMEQLGTPFLEPWRGADVIQRFYNTASGRDPDGVAVLRDTIRSFESSETLEALFRDFAITNYTHNLDVGRLPNPRRYQYLDETAGGGGTLYDAVARVAIPASNTIYSDSVNSWAIRYFEINVQADECQAVGFWVKTKEGKNLSYAVVGVQAGNRVTQIYHGSGSEFYRALVNPPTDPYQRMALIVIGMNHGADFDYAFGTGSISGQIRTPTSDRMAFVGSMDIPERFQSRLLLQGPAILTPSGAGTISMRGLDPSLFEVTLRSVATGATYPATILNTTYVDGEYWLVLQAPRITNPADGILYDLEICFCERQGSCTHTLTKSMSVIYANKEQYIMHVIDRSGSMNYPNPVENKKITAAKNALQSNIVGGNDDDHMGIVSFNGDRTECNNDATREHALSSVLTHRVSLSNTVGGIIASGWTSIGDGLIMGRDELLAVALPEADKSIILYSDGIENEGDKWNEPNAACGTPAVSESFDRVTGFANSIRIDTIAFGRDAKAEVLSNIAGVADGYYYAVSTDAPSLAASSIAGAESTSSIATVNPIMLQVPNRLAETYRTIEEDLHNQDRLFSRISNLTAGTPENFVIAVTEKAGGGVVQAEFSFNWHLIRGNVSVTLHDPDGKMIDSASRGWTINEEPTGKVYQYDGVLPTGNYAVELVSGDDVQALTTLSGRVVHGVDLEVELSQVPGQLPQTQCDPFPLYDHLRGLPIQVIANLTDSEGGITGLTVEATVYNPDGSLNRLTLYDDGDHGDSLSGDGIYANGYTRTPFFSQGGVIDDPPLGPPSGEWGSYTVVVAADGLSNFREEFTRSQQMGFHVFEYERETDCFPDTDGDKLPDRWEDLYGLDSSDPTDVGDDNDRDGLTNEAEFFYGTHPFDPDTDNGGEGDGSEVNNNRDPLYDKDDQMTPIVDYGIMTERTDIPLHEPQPNTNILHFPVSVGYLRMQIWRTDPTWLGFQMVQEIDLEVDPSGIFYDDGLTNGVTYTYYLIAQGLSAAQTAPTDFFVGTPKADPLPPKGWLVINNDAWKVDGRRITLRFDTSDDATEVRVSEDATFASAKWIPLTESSQFELSNPKATAADSSAQEPYLAIVYAQYRDKAGNESTVYSDSIIVDEFGDEDEDGLPNNQDPDDDNDGLTDEEELAIFHTDPFKRDTDGDGVDDGQLPMKKLYLPIAAK